MAKVKNFQNNLPCTISVPLNDDYSINEPEFRAFAGLKHFTEKEWTV